MKTFTGQKFDYNAQTSGVNLGLHQMSLLSGVAAGLIGFNSSQSVRSHWLHVWCVTDPSAQHRSHGMGSRAQKHNKAPGLLLN